MVNILNTILGSQDNNALSEIGRQVGLPQEQMQGVAAQLLPMLMQGFGHKLGNTNAPGGGLQSIIDLFHGQNAIQAPDVAQNPAMVGEPDTIDSGNSILSQIFGSKDVSRTAAEHTATTTGTDYSVVKKVLPLLAVLAFNAFKNHAAQASSGAAGSQPSATQPGLLDHLLQYIAPHGQQSTPISEILNSLRR